MKNLEGVGVRQTNGGNYNSVSARNLVLNLIRNIHTVCI